jgi:hypothetical protein
LRNFSCTKDNQNNNEDEHELHPPKRSKHLEPRFVSEISTSKKKWAQYTEPISKNLLFHAPGKTSSAKPERLPLVWSTNSVRLTLQL